MAEPNDPSVPKPDPAAVNDALQNFRLSPLFKSPESFDALVSEVCPVPEIAPSADELQDRLDGISKCRESVHELRTLV